MEVNKTLKTPKGTVRFEGELNQDEADLVIGLGLTTLLEQGAIPFTIIDKDNVASFVDGNDDVN